MRIIFAILTFLSLVIMIPILAAMLIIGLPILTRGKRAYKNYILSAVALSMYISIAGLGFTYAFFKMRKDEFADFVKRIAVSQDQGGNVVMQELFDDVLTKDHSEQFGNEDETVSSVLGKNLKSGNLSILGRIIGLILDAFQKDHIEVSIGK